MSIEQDIHQLLLDSRSPTEVADQLIAKWKAEKLEATEKIAIANFLLQSGRYLSLLELIKSSLQNSKKIPWAQLLEAAKQAGLKMNESVLAAALDGARFQEMEDQLVLSSAFDVEFPEIPELRRRSHEAARKATEQKRQSLLDKLEYLKTQRMFEEEGKVLNELLQLFPGADFSALKKNYDERWAREVVSQRSSSPSASHHHELKEKSPEDLKMEQLISSEVQSAAGKNPHLRYDYTIMLYFMELFRPAIAVLKTEKASKAVDWLHLELLIRARQFVEALELASALETKYANDPSAAFAVIYARAQALFGLGQKQDAIELLNSIIKIRPNYRSAQVLVRDWAGGES